MTARLFAWTMLAVLAAFLLNNYLTHWQELPGASAALAGGGLSAWLQLALYPVLVAVAVAYVMKRPGINERQDAERISGINTFLIRAAFWAVVLIGCVDLLISFLRVEDLLAAIVGEQLAVNLGRSSFRGANVHMPLVLVAIAIAAMKRGTLGFHWLALLVVMAELLIVIGRFVFSYEQAFLADLVRFWYAALFLFASAYTLLEDGHVRVDIFYAAFNTRRKGMVDSLGALVLGITLCWTILILGMGSKSAIINSPMLVYEVTQAGFGLYVKYLMAGFLGVFAVSMMIQFTAAFLNGIADYLGEAGHVDHDPHPPTAS